MKKNPFSARGLAIILFVTAGILAAGTHPLLSSEIHPLVTTNAQSAGAPSPQAISPAAGDQEVLRVLAGRSMAINSPDLLKRVAVTNDQIATAVVISPNQVVIHGVAPGNVTLMLWDEQEQLRAFDLQVLMDLEPLRESIQRLLPNEKIEVRQSGSAVVLAGEVSSQEVVAQAEAVAQATAKSVVNLLNPAPMKQTVLLQVKFAEVNRSALQQLGINILSTGALNTPGAISTQQFRPPGTTSVTGVIGSAVKGFATSFQLSDLLNIFVFRPDLNLGLMIRALQERNLLQILAEPNLLALGRKEASFLAGGEFPVPIVQGGTGIQTVTVQFKEFGVRLKFTANPEPDGIITLKVAPEVSTLDYANAVTLGGFTIPALSTRRAETEVQLRDGQSFAIAGLIDNRLTKIASKIPWLGDVPFLGKLFQSQEFQQNNSELLVTVTPQLVKPLEPGQVPSLPSFVLPFMDTQKFDGKIGEAPAGTKPKKP